MATKNEITTTVMIIIKREISSENHSLSKDGFNFFIALMTIDEYAYFFLHF